MLINSEKCCFRGNKPTVEWFQIQVLIFEDCSSNIRKDNPSNQQLVPRKTECVGNFNMNICVMTWVQRSVSRLHELTPSVHKSAYLITKGNPGVQQYSDTFLPSQFYLKAPTTTCFGPPSAADCRKNSQQRTPQNRIKMCARWIQKIRSLLQAMVCAAFCILIGMQTSNDNGCTSTILQESFLKV